ncbi:MAG: hypothetical protein M0000_07325 [Actinomycetota bacterium]|nr:hypothetical protein [Actinomycetota bacterium]
MRPVPYNESPPERKAKELGLCIQWEHPGLLMLDLDSKKAHTTALRRISLLRRFVDVEYFTTRSKSKHWHIYIALPEILDLDLRPDWRYIIQALMGSDLDHETASQRDFEEFQAKSVLFETPEENAKVEKWRCLTNKKD